MCWKEMNDELHKYFFILEWNMSETDILYDRIV